MIDDDVIVILKNVIVKTFKITNLKNLAAIFQKKATFSWRRIRHSKSGAEHKAMMEVVCLVADNGDGGDGDENGADDDDEHKAMMELVFLVVFLLK